MGGDQKKNPKEDPASIGDREIDGGLNFYSLEKEIALGKQLAQEVERQARIVKDAVIAEYVNRVGQNIVRNSDAKVPFTIKVVDTEEVNAFALPGGFFFVNSGLILKAESESELAGVMAHEIAHVACRHGTKQASKGELMGIGMIAGSIAAGYGWTGYAVSQAGSLAIPVSMLMFSRKMEREADHYGLQYLYKSGYDPASFVDFLEKMEAMERRKPGSVSRVFATHPMDEDRIKAAQRELDNRTYFPPRAEYIVNTSEFNDVKARVAMLHNRRKVEQEDAGNPRLRRAAGSDRPVDEGGGTGENKTGDDRPTLQRRPYGGGQ